MRFCRAKHGSPLSRVAHEIQNPLWLVAQASGLGNTWGVLSRVCAYEPPGTSRTHGGNHEINFDYRPHSDPFWMREKPARDVRQLWIFSGDRCFCKLLDEHSPAAHANFPGDGASQSGEPATTGPANSISPTDAGSQTNQLHHPVHWQPSVYELQLILRIPLLILCLSACIGTAKASDVRDGGWWTGMSRIAKSAYVLGFFDGQDYASVVWDLSIAQVHTPFVPERAKEDAEIEKRANGQIDRDFGNISAGKLVDGLDAVYGDYRNTRIRINDAMTIVVRSMDGTPDAEIQKLLERGRAKGSK